MGPESHTATKSMFFYNTPGSLPSDLFGAPVRQLALRSKLKKVMQVLLLALVSILVFLLLLLLLVGHKSIFSRAGSGARGEYIVPV